MCLSCALNMLNACMHAHIFVHMYIFLKKNHTIGNFSHDICTILIHSNVTNFKIKTFGQAWTILSITVYVYMISLAITLLHSGPDMDTKDKPAVTTRIICWSISISMHFEKYSYIMQPFNVFSFTVTEFTSVLIINGCSLYMRFYSICEYMYYKAAN